MSYQNPTEFLHDFYMAGNVDGKPLIDSEPRQELDYIAAKYSQDSQQPNFDWEAFYNTHFDCPDMPAHGLKAAPGRTAEQHIEAMWPMLTRYAPKDEYTLLHLPNKTIVPGERFSESYYWDSYFTMLGLAKAGKWNLVKGMVDNCAYQIDRFGYVPNGNRQYYLGRSQPPVFSHMVRLLAEHNAALVGEQQQDSAVGYGATLVAYLPQMMREHQFWMAGRDKLVSGLGGSALKRVVLMPDGSFLNRYYDANATPRPESYRKDIMNGQKAGLARPERPDEYYRNIRAAAESGWDFSGRWCDDGKNLRTINTTSIVPIDLNSLLYDLEKTIEEALEHAGEPARAGYYHREAARRAAAINKYQWDERQGFYFDYHLQRQEHTNYPTIAAAFPLHSYDAKAGRGIANLDQARRVAKNLERDFLLDNGFATSLHETEEQWDGDILWAPAQRIACEGLRKYGYSGLADRGRKGWTERNLVIFEQTRQFFEKIPGSKQLAAANKGEYQVQTGFGWTNGVLLDSLHS